MAVSGLTGDAAAITVLHASFEAQKAAFLNDPYRVPPSAASGCWPSRTRWCETAWAFAMR